MEKENQNLLNNPAIVIVSLALVFAGGYYLFNNKNEVPNSQVSENTINESQDAQQKEIDALREEIENLKNQEPQTIVKEVEKPSAKSNLTTVINQWRPRIAYVECEWWGPQGVVDSSAGSAVLGPKSAIDTYFLFTNKHVVSNERDNPATQCNIWLPGMTNPYTITADLERMMMDDISTDPYYDYGNIHIRNPNQQIISVANNSKYEACNVRADVGEQVLILGYPTIGSLSDITVTEGIISGYENGYYITSAKVEQGNSGGAAILVEDNCYLGIPSFAYSGQLESLARILDMSSSAPIWSQ